MGRRPSCWLLRVRWKDTKLLAVPAGAGPRAARPDRTTEQAMKYGTLYRQLGQPRRPSPGAAYPWSSSSKLTSSPIRASHGPSPL